MHKLSPWAQVAICSLPAIVLGLLALGALWSAR